MKFPYGMCDFYAIMTGGYFYVDRTDRISQIEDIGPHLLFLRPRRFGKSLLLSMLENYYDVAKAEEFEQLFGHLDIGQNPTPLRNQYLVLNWDFSAVMPHGEPEEIQRNLHDHINGCIEQFKARYEKIVDYNIEIDSHNALRSFQSVLAAVQSSPYKLYLLIDEYDNFANEVLMSGRAAGQQRYEGLLYGEGALKSIFKAVKSATKGLGLERAFITGVSPVVMSDITSGHNIAENIYLSSEFNDLCGFDESEIRAILEQFVTDGKLSPEQFDDVLRIMRTFYNGYAFTYNHAPVVYNPTLALYFLKHLYHYGSYPRRIMDSNLAMDKGKIAYISRLPHGEHVILNAVSEKKPVCIAELGDRFGVEDILSATKDTAFMASLLYYFGVLTLTDRYSNIGELTLKIPNLVVRKFYVERLQDMLLPEFQDKEDIQQAAREFYQSGNLQPVRDFLECRYFKIFDNRDYRWANELTIKTAFLTILFNDTFYIMDSETPQERRYSDLTMVVRPDMRQFQLLDFLFEFKYVELGKHGLHAEKVRQMGEEALLEIPAVKSAFQEAYTSLKQYRRILEETYRDQLRLHSYRVVSIGFERVLWEEIPVND